jgi:3-hydroxyisobutyrate dehydrogenase
MKKIGFVGVGRMGANMARRLKDGGFEITALYDLDTATAEALALELQATACKTLADVTRLSEAIITVVSDDQAMRVIYQNPSDHLLMGAKGKLFLNCATITPSVHVALKQEADAAGADMLE